MRLARVLGLFGRATTTDGPPAEVQRLLAARGEARARRDFRRGDELRDEIGRLGWLVEDTRGRPAAHAERAIVAEDRVYGRNPVLELLRAHGRRADEIAVLAGGRGPLAEVVALARRAGVKVSYRTREQLTAIAGSDRHQGVVARVASAEYVDLAALLAIPRRGEAPFFVALDQVQDPRNFGALLRTAEAFGAHGVIVPKHHQVGLTDAAARAAMGAVEYLSVARETNLGERAGSPEEIWGMGLRWCDGIRGAGLGASLTGPLCLVLGSEGEGLRPHVAKACDVLLTIPLRGARSAR